MKLNDNIEYPYKGITDMGMIDFKNFKETGKLI